MNDNKIQNESENIAFGDHLQSARLNKKMSIRELADRLRLSPKIIESLEASDYDKLPGSTFVKGYVRSIAQCLDIDPETVLALYHPPVEESEFLTSTKTAEQQQELSDPMMKWASLSILALLTLLLLFWLVSSLQGESKQNQSELAMPSNLINDQSQHNGTEIQEQSLSPHSINDIEANSVSGLDSLALADPSITTKMLGAANSEQQSASVEVSNENPATVMGGSSFKVYTYNNIEAKDTLKILLKGKTWAEIRDVNGKLLLSGILNASDKRIALSGFAPFNVFLGDAHQVDLYFDGQQYDHLKYMRKNKTARFKVDYE